MQFGLFPHHGVQSDINDSLECKAAYGVSDELQRKGRNLFLVIARVFLSHRLALLLKAFTSGACEPC